MTPMERAATQSSTQETVISGRGKQIYADVVLPKTTTDDEGKFVAIDVDSGEYELDRDDDTAIDRLLDRLPKAHIWLARVGHRTAYRMV